VICKLLVVDFLYSSTPKEISYKDSDFINLFLAFTQLQSASLKEQWVISAKETW
jgi:hypothetical protein